MKTRSMIMTMTVLTATRLYAATHYVSFTGTSEPPFSSWETAATNIQNAVDAAGPTGTVLVAAGHYMLDGHVSVSNAVQVHGVAGYLETTVDAGGASRCFVINNSQALVEGFTMTNGLDSTERKGGGVLLETGTLRSCRITGCRVANDYAGGGGIWNDDGLIEHCIIEGNTSDDWGGGVHNGGVMRNCLVRNNEALCWGGGGVFNEHGTVANCTVISNRAVHAQGQGGGIYNRGSAPYGTGTVVNCVIWYNSASTDADYHDAGPDTETGYSCIPSGASYPGMVTNAPMLAVVRGGQIQLSASSPCIDAGTNQSWLANTSDLYGNPRTFGGSVDIGTAEAILICTSIRMNGTVSQADFYAPPSATCDVEYAVSLHGSWSNLYSTVIATQGVMTISHSNTFPRCFYRAKWMK